MKMFKTVILSMLIAGSVGSVAFAAVSPMEQGLDDSSFLKEITFTNWLNRPEDASTILKISQLFYNALSMQLANNAITMHLILKLFNLITIDGQVDGVVTECDKQMDMIMKLRGLKVDEVSWLTRGEKIVAIKSDDDFQKLKEKIKKMQDEEFFKEDDSMQLINTQIKIVFLGGDIDPTESEAKAKNFPWATFYGPVDPIDKRVFATAALLSLKNPGQVLMSTSLMGWLQEDDAVKRLYPKSKDLEPRVKLEGERCPICWDLLSDIKDRILEVLPCGHVICREDLATVRTSVNPNCPLCSGPLH